MNKAILIGRLTADPEISTTSSGKKYAKYRLAVDRMTKQEGQQNADFISCIVWEKGAEFAERYLTKGTKIAIEGRIQTGSYEKDGVKHYTTDIVVERHEFCEKRDSGAAAPAAYGQPPQNLGKPAYTPPSAYGQWGQAPQPPQAPPQADFQMLSGEDDQLPF